MGIVFQSDIGEASPIAKLGFFAGMICDEKIAYFIILPVMFSNDAVI
jgi:hypothetical protein